MATYELFVVKDLGELKQDEETIVEVRNMATVETRRVRAILSSSPKKMPDADTLWIRWQRGYKHPDPWAIRIIEDLGSLTESLVET
ncbi:MAG: hypothetical protein HY654_14165 [Acidobacteria bacterium]|nr:hypothetical protein [Acidobacteriota bacterium]